MSLATRCTACGTVFRVAQDQLKASEGWVRCGRCSEVFNGLEGLFDLEGTSGPMPLARDAFSPAPAPAPLDEAPDAMHERPDEPPSGIARTEAEPSESTTSTLIDSQADTRNEFHVDPSWAARGDVEFDERIDLVDSQVSDEALAAESAKKAIKINSTCTVFAGAELRDRLSLGQRREDILAGLHRAIMLRAMSLLARSGGVKSEFTFTGGVCNNAMAVKVLRDLVDDNYGKDIVLNIHPDSIYMGALGAAMFALDDHRAGRVGPLPDFVRDARSEIRS